MKKIVSWIAVVLVLILITYISMFLNTNGIVNEVKQVMLGKVDVSITTGTPLSRYNLMRWFPEAKMEAKITRLLTIHNFFDGYIWVVYSYEGKDADGAVMTGAGDTVSRWTIHRENGKWEVVDIKEAP